MIGAGVTVQVNIVIGIRTTDADDMHIPAPPLDGRWKRNTVCILAFVTDGNAAQSAICLQGDGHRAIGGPLPAIRLKDCSFRLPISPRRRAVSRLESSTQFYSNWNVQGIRQFIFPRRRIDDAAAVGAGGGQRTLNRRRVIVYTITIRAPSRVGCLLYTSPSPRD